jgi:PAS domain S-box-containing protein
LSGDVLARAWDKTLGTDRKQFTLFFENMMDAFFYNKIVVDTLGKPIDYIFLEVNDAFENMTGLKKTKIIGKKATEVFNGLENDVENWISVYGKVALTCESIQFDDLTKPTSKWFHVSAYCPEKGYFVAIFEDITERKKAEQELREAKNDWERTFDTIPDFIAILDNKHKIVRVNRAMAKQLGVNPQQAIGLSCYKCVYGTELPPEFCPHAKTLEDGKEHVEEVHEPRLGGDFIVSTTPIKDDRERVIGSVHVARDITERKKDEREIERLASFPTLNPNPVFEVDFNGKIIYANPATKILFPDLEFFGNAHPFISDWQNIVKNFENKTALFFGREVKVADHWYHEQMYFVPQTQKIRVYTIDIDELKKTEESRAKAQVKLEENAVLLEEYASQMEELAEQRAQQLKNAERLVAIGQTAGMVGHDIRNPLQAITGDMYLIKEELKIMPDSENKDSILESVAAVNENITYIDKIVSDLQDYTRTLRPSIQEVDLAELTEGTILTINIPERIELTKEIKDNSRAIETDVAYLRRILTNLITNAVQAMPNQGKLIIKANKKKDKIIISVEDTGVGIPEEVKTKMFTPLFTTKSKGQGLGLAVVKRLVEALNGQITFESQPNKGTKFIVEIPQKQKTK